MFFSGWAELRHILVVGTLAYVTLIMLLRVSGKRTLSSLNAFDLVITVALGSTLAAGLTQKEFSLAGMALAFSLLIGLQFAITWVSARSDRIDRVIKPTPRLLFHEGEFFVEDMKRERVTREEVLSAMRCQGIKSLGEVEAVVLESNAQLTCLRKWIDAKRGQDPPSESTLSDVESA